MSTYLSFFCLEFRNDACDLISTHCAGISRRFLLLINKKNQYHLIVESLYRINWKEMLWDWKWMEGVLILGEVFIFIIVVADISSLSFVSSPSLVSSSISLTPDNYFLFTFRIPRGNVRCTLYFNLLGITY